ncbi:hypothetical protein GCM10009665_06600 [Kitasatospora nipponensis]|uniref:Uncharacterized protein n=1 Tax=Kitasatospora nipponensis TaxID=258049 RepID=A0ABP4GDH8_9ACTN
MREQIIERLTERGCNRGELLTLGVVVAVLPPCYSGTADAHLGAQLTLAKVHAPPDRTYAPAVELTWGHMNSSKGTIGQVGAVTGQL